MVSIRMFRRGVLPLALLFAVILLGGTSGYAQEKGKPGITREELRQQIMRFTSSSGERVGYAFDFIIETAQTPKVRRRALDNYLVFAQSALEIGVAPDPEVNLLDMVVSVTLTRIVAEEYWVPQVYGDQGRKLVEALRTVEAEIWAIAAEVMTPEQQKELRFLIEEWRKRNPDQIFVEYVRFRDFAKIHGESALAKAQRSGGFLGIKGATRAVDEALLVAERVMVYVQRVPEIARLTARAVLFDVLEQPQMQELMSNTTTLAKAMNQTAKMTEELPELITEQRDQIMKQVTVERKAAIDQLMEGVATERKAVIPQIIEVIDKAAAKGEVLIDHTFWHAVVLIVIFLIGSVLAGLSYRYASERLLRSRQGRGAS